MTMPGTNDRPRAGEDHTDEDGRAGGADRSGVLAA